MSSPIEQADYFRSTYTTVRGVRAGHLPIRQPVTDELVRAINARKKLLLKSAKSGCCREKVLRGEATLQQSGVQSNEPFKGNSRSATLDPEVVGASVNEINEYFPTIHTCSTHIRPSREEMTISLTRDMPNMIFSDPGNLNGVLLAHW